jgi:hypothetical protein
MTRLSKNGKEYQIWTVGNLKGASLTIFMFDGAYNEHRLVPRASLLIFLNPKLLPSKNKTSIALSVTTAEQMIVLGTASNMGCCRSLKKDGRRCTNVINTQCSKYCDYHINSQYKKISRGRMDVAGSKTGKGMRSSRNNNNTRNSGSSSSRTNSSNSRQGIVGVPSHFSKGNYAVPGLGGHTVGIGARGMVANRPMNEFNAGGSGGSHKSRQLAMARFRGGNDSLKRLKQGLEAQSKKTKHKQVKAGFKSMASLLGAEEERTRIEKKRKRKKKDLLGQALSSSQTPSSSGLSKKKKKK